MVERGFADVSDRRDGPAHRLRPAGRWVLYLWSMSPSSPPTSPLLSIVTPVRDQARFLVRCLASVRGRAPDTAEHIVMDGGSTDGSEAILRAATGLASWTSGPDRGQSHAINQGFARARGLFGGWLNADDWYTPGALDEVAAFLRANPETDMLVCRARFVAEDGRTVHEPTPPERIDEPSLLSLRSGWFAGHSIAQPEVFFRLEMFRAVGALDERNHLSMDHHLWLKFLERGARVRQIDRVVACQGVHAGQKTADRLRATRSIVESSRAWLDRRHAHWPLRAPDVSREIEGLERKLALATRYAAAIDRAFNTGAGGPFGALGPAPKAWPDLLRSVASGPTCDLARLVIASNANEQQQVADCLNLSNSPAFTRFDRLSDLPSNGASCIILHRVLGACDDPASLLRAAFVALRPDGTVVISTEPERSETHDLYLKRLRARCVNKVTQPDELIIGPRPDATLRPLLESPEPTHLETHPNPRGIRVEDVATAVGSGIRAVASQHFGGFDFLPLAPFAAPPKMTPNGPDGAAHHCWRTCVLRASR